VYLDNRLRFDKLIALTAFDHALCAALMVLISSLVFQVYRTQRSRAVETHQDLLFAGSASRRTSLEIEEVVVANLNSASPTAEVLLKASRHVKYTRNKYSSSYTHRVPCASQSAQEQISDRLVTASACWCIACLWLDNNCSIFEDIHVGCGALRLRLGLDVDGNCLGLLQNEW
jgi:hypothetical protein